ncbi:hypothetical protein ACN6MY_19180 [Peribacillus sp. B-H-3]|uniref:hypothetical protein n=1 Tax=Peribacillus sp. B-H-3 TaxID=3400420 RepID=UPI003B026171
MKRWMSLLCLIIAILAGCTNSHEKESRPPKAEIVTGGKHYKTVLGSYCWEDGDKGVCVDSVWTKGGKRPLAVPPIAVQPGADIEVKIDYDPQPNEIHLSQVNGKKEIVLPVEKGHFKAPRNTGTYNYTYSVWWMDEKDKHLSHGDASYEFDLNVQ